MLSRWRWWAVAGLMAVMVAQVVLTVRGESLRGRPEWAEIG